MLERNINETLLNNEPSSKALVQMLLNIDEKKTLGPTALYHHFPLYPDNLSDKLITANILFCSQKFGIVIFKSIDYSNRTELNISEIVDELDQIDRLIYAKIIKDAPDLRKGRRELKLNITTIVYLNNFNKDEDEVIEFGDFLTVTSEIELDSFIRFYKSPLTDAEYKDLKATIEGSKAIPRPAERKTSTNSKKDRGYILTLIENEICSFDLEQKRAALLTIDGAQRIRGLAGSGKTIILAMKAALLHLQNDQADILYTYYTKTLHDIVKRLITRFYRQFAEKDPNWDRIHIMHAWGGKGLEGVYYNACNANYISPINYTDAKSSSQKDPFEYVCEQLNEEILIPFYDYALLDEAQDFPVTFYRLCRQLTKNNRVVWAYDDFQNILQVNLQSEKETFGKDENGDWHIDFDKKDDELQDIILHQCYRNPRKILVTAFALGLGIYNQDENNRVQIIQRLESNAHWSSLGFEIEEGDSNVGSKMVINRPLENSPLLKNELLDDEDEIIKILSFSSSDEECNKVCELILQDIESGLNPEDISVICLDNLYAKRYFSDISRCLTENGLKVFNLLTAPNDNTIYKIKGHITLSTIFRAKGNEGGSVYALGIDTVFSPTKKNDITERNKLFTVITRAQGWITLTGTGNLDQCLKEFDLLKKNNFKLIFIQPSEEEVNTIRQDINKNQFNLNKLDKMAEELAKNMGVTKEELLGTFMNDKKAKGR
ncbi:hypothetical protein AQ505_10925 [Pedobacter sp. PACM 27299]|uniref:DEAD/DEAH box helicase n=1 Tax=Pedobacter sp. PACM 27299 TaxID=1727164 RepID=UPI000706D1E4|nr:ATP-binding domain-containing protein [Pedobacter sp. PACM 27299]ALL05960.1 hypothetical protein AQ505_10925 [Pedobacter sp. PACM 27299]